MFELVDEYFRRAELAFERAFHSGWNEMAASIEPLYNIFVSGDEVVVTIDLPYVESPSVEITLPANDSIEVTADTKQPISFHDLGVHHRKAEFTCYHVRINLPVAVDKSGLAKRLKRGVLEIRLPRLH